MSLNILFLVVALQAGGTATIDWKSELRQTDSGNQIVLTGDLKPGVDHVTGMVDFTTCIGTACNPPEDWSFDVAFPTAATLPSGLVPSTATLVPSAAPVQQSVPMTVVEPAREVSPEGDSEGASSLWALILEAVLWGFAMLLTPCVFPMVPMTISFFMKGAILPPRAGSRHSCTGFSSCFSTRFRSVLS